MDFGLCLVLFGDFHFSSGFATGGPHSPTSMAFVKHNIIGMSFEVRYALATSNSGYCNELSGDYTICRLGARRDGFVNFYLSSAATA
jgi:hypothetical protein